MTYRPRFYDAGDEGHPDEVSLVVDALDTEATMAMANGDKERAEALLTVKRRMQQGRPHNDGDINQDQPEENQQTA